VTAVRSSGTSRLADSLHQWATHRHIDLDRHRQPDLTGKLGGEHDWKDDSEIRLRPRTPTDVKPVSPT